MASINSILSNLYHLRNAIQWELDAIIFFYEDWLTSTTRATPSYSPERFSPAPAWLNCLESYPTPPGTPWTSTTSEESYQSSPESPDNTSDVIEISDDEEENNHL